MAADKHSPARLQEDQALYSMEHQKAVAEATRVAEAVAVVRLAEAVEAAEVMAVEAAREESQREMEVLRTQLAHLEHRAGETPSTPQHFPRCKWIGAAAPRGGVLH